MKKEIIIGTRGSKLALVQAEWVSERIKERNPEFIVSIKKIRTKGDKITDVALAKIGDKGLFVKEIEQGLIDGEVDLAVHSCKDLPTQLPISLCLGAIPKRKDAHDVLISKNRLRLSELPPNSKVGTSSLRRRAQIINYRKDFKILDIRGNLDTRLRKLNEGKFDAIIVAAAGLVRLGLENLITQVIPYEICLPAVGQGALAIEVRKDDHLIKRIVKDFDDYHTHQAILAERSLLSALQGGCQIPIGSYAEVLGDKLIINAMVANLNGSRLIRRKDEGEIHKPDELGKRVAEYLLKMGADKILEEIRRQEV